MRGLVIKTANRVGKPTIRYEDLLDSYNDEKLKRPNVETRSGGQYLLQGKGVVGELSLYDCKTNLVVNDKCNNTDGFTISVN